MNRSLKLSMLVALALGSSQVMALSLGQVQIKSALGQPLLAEIPVHPASPAELQNLSVQLASSEAFARAGIVDGRTTIPLHFSVVNGAHGKIIRITSSQSVDNPYLDLLLEVHSKAGKSVREVAILLDPATSTPSAAPAVAAATRPAAHTGTKAAASTSTRAPATEHSANVPSLKNGQYGPVKQGDTLSAIARNTAPTGVNVEQMLLALKQANPNAFYHDNINALKTGAVLRVPTAAEAQAMTIAAAVAEVRRQNSDWRGGTPGKTALVADAATRASASSAPSNTSSGMGDRLALLPAKSGNSAVTQGGNAAGKSDKSAAGLRQDLLRSQESLASLQEQSSDLKARLKDLSGINDKNVHLLSLKNSEIAELQAKLAAANKTASMPATKPSVASAPAPSKQVLATTNSTAVNSAIVKPASTSSTSGAMTVPATATSSAAAVKLASAGSTAPAALAAAVAAPPVKPVAKPIVKHVVKPVAKTSPASSVEEPWYMQTWAWAAGAGAVIVLILLALLSRRRKPTSAAGEKFSKSSASLADRFASTSAPAMPTGNITGDDVDQEDLLDQLAEHPDDIYLHLELITLYYSRRDVDHFEAAAEAMHAHITNPQQDEWQDVLHMGEDLAPGHPLFDHHPELPADEAAAARSEFNIDDYADKNDVTKIAPVAPVSAPPPLPSGGPKKVSEYNFNFDLTKAATTTAADQPAATSTPTASKLPVADAHAADTSIAAVDETTSDWHFDATDHGLMGDDHGHAADELADDPVDTKLDLARAYLDMGDADGARAMLDEVIKEGSKMQQDTAKQLLGNLH